MNSPSVAYLNGHFVVQTDASIPIEDRGLLFGQSAYEVVRFYDGRPFALAEHLYRFERSLEAIGIPRVPELANLGPLSRELIERNALSNATVYWQVTRGATRRNLTLGDADPPQPNVFALVYPQPPLEPDKPPVELRLITTEDLRWGRVDVKTTMMVPAILAREEAERKGADGAILWRREGPETVVTESTQANLLAWIDGALRTHPRDRRVLAGVSLGLIVDLARARGLSVDERALTLDELHGATEVMLSGTSTHVAAVVEIDGRTVGNGSTGPVTRSLHADLLREIARRCEG